MTIRPHLRQLIYAVIDGERDYQQTLIHESEAAGGLHSVAEYILYMQDYLAEAQKHASRVWGVESNAKALDTLRKVVALGVVCMEHNGMVARPNTLSLGDAKEVYRDNERRGRQYLNDHALVVRVPEKPKPFSAADVSAADNFTGLPI
jgi:hypothetical protein